jgi:prevent-host-death family protein
MESPTRVGGSHVASTGLRDLTNLVIRRMILQVKNKFVNVAAAKASLPELIERAASGETIILARAGKPRAKLVPLKPSPKGASKRVPGKGKGRFRMKKGFDEPLPERVLAAFEGPS